jgi:hypothetical protein
VLFRDIAAPATQGFKHDGIRVSSIVSRPVCALPSESNHASSSDARPVNCPTLATPRDGARGLSSQAQSPFAAQDFTARLSQPQCVETLVVNLDQAQHDELTEYGSPLVGVQIRANSKRAQAFVSELEHFLSALAPQHIDDLLRSE